MATAPFEPFEIDERGKEIVCEVRLEVLELLPGRGAGAEDDLARVGDEGERSLFITIAHDERGCGRERVDEIGVGSEALAKDIRDVLIVFERCDAAPADSDASDAAPERRRMAVDDDDPSLFQLETLHQVRANLAGRGIAVAREERVVTARIGTVESSASDEGIVDDGERYAVATLGGREIVISFCFDCRALACLVLRDDPSFRECDHLGRDSEDRALGKALEMAVEELLKSGRAGGDFFCLDGCDFHGF